MPEAETSQFHQPPGNLPPISLRKKPFEPSEPREVHLLVVRDDRGSREYPLGGEMYSIGRSETANIRLFSLFVSRRHATLVRQQQEDGNYKYRIIDGNLKGQLSANGIVINGCKLQAHELKDGDEVVFSPGVSAAYYLCQRDEKKSGPLDPFDITLIDPSRVDESDG